MQAHKLLAPEAAPLPGLPAFLREHRAEIVEDLTRSVGVLHAARNFDERELMDHLPRLIDALVDASETLEAGERPDLLHREGRAHALQRFDMGLEPAEIVADYAVLRRCINRVWTAREMPPEGALLVDQLIDWTSACSLAHFQQVHERTLVALDGVSVAALEYTDLEDILRRFLRVLVENIPAVDTGMLFLRDGDELRIRAAVGLDLAPEIADRFSMHVGEGFVGLVAAEKRPIAIRSGAEDPLVKMAVAAELGRRAGLAFDNARLYAEAQRATRSRQEVLAVVSHDLRNPFGTILFSAASLLAEDATLPRERVQTAARRIKSGAARMERMIKDLLDMASIEANQLALDVHEHDLRVVATDALEQMRALARCPGREQIARVDWPLRHAIASHGDHDQPSTGERRLSACRCPGTRPTRG